jgi:hypothetical protein
MNNKKSELSTIQTSNTENSKISNITIDKFYVLQKKIGTFLFIFPIINLQFNTYYFYLQMIYVNILY